MNPVKRYLLLALGFLIFIIAVPVFVLGVRGFIYDFNERQLVKTGMVVARTEPRNAIVTVEGRSGIKKDRTPSAIRFLLPDDYHVKIEREGFHTWEKVLVVRGGLVAWVNTNSPRLVLLPKNPRLLSESETYQASEEREGRYIYILEPGTLTPPTMQLVAYETNTPENQTVLIKNIPYRQGAEVAAYVNGLGFILADRVLYQIGNEELHYIADGVEFASWNDRTNKLTYGNANELSLYNPNDPSDNQKELLVRTVESGGNFCIMPELGYVLRSYGNIIRAVELDGRNRRNTYDVFTSNQPLEVIDCDREGTKVVVKEGNSYKTYSLRQKSSS